MAQQHTTATYGMPSTGSKSHSTPHAESKMIHLDNTS